ncbi:hypothetical protein STRA110950_05925 [Streptobacillus ratti]
MGWINLSKILKEDICVEIMKRYNNIFHAIDDFKKYNLNQTILDKLLKASKYDDKYYINKCMEDNIKVVSFKDKNYPKKLIQSGFIFPYIYLKTNIDINKLENILAFSSNYDLIENTKKILDDTLELNSNISLSLVTETDADKYIQKKFSNKNNNMIYINSRDFKYIPKYYDLDKDILISIEPFEDLRNKNNILKSTCLLAGISDFLYVPESFSTSRAMIISKIMNDMGKEIFASTSYGNRYSGCNYILRNNIAKLVMSKDDINKEVNNG